MYRVEKNVPIPEIKRNGGRSLTAVLRSMRKGESVAFNKKRYGTVTAAAAKVFGTGKYTVRSNGTTARVWRV